MKSIDKVNQLNKSDFLLIFGNVFEKSEWISVKVFDLKPFKSLEEFISKFMQIYEGSKDNQILNILNAHPELAVEKKLTGDSKKEQSEARLNNCTIEEFDEFKTLNMEYKKKFKFPFIIAVKGKDKNDILNNFRQRILNDIKSEFKEAKLQVKKIAKFRLNEIFDK
tara:strand:- start:170 stop:667 length:498 start_codon:yes stop_codon:yes gene_type:complete